MFAFFNKLRFQTKLNIGITTIVVIMALTLLPLVGQMTSRALVVEHKKRGAALAENLAARAATPLLAEDYLRLKNLVDGLLEVGDVMYAFIQDDAGHVRSHTFRGGFPVDLGDANAVNDTGMARAQLLVDKDHYIYDFAAPIMLAGKRLGTARIGLSRDSVMISVDQLVVTLAMLFGGGLFIATMIGTVFARTVTRRLAFLREHAEEIVRKDLGSSLPLGSMPSPYGHFGSGDEIDELGGTLDLMAKNLRRHIRELVTAEKSLQDQKNLLRTILDVTPDRYSLVDTRMIYQACNESFANSVGLIPEVIVGKTDFDLYPEDVAEQRHLEGRDIIQTRRRLDKEVRLVTPEGERWFHVVSIPVYGRNNRLAGLLRTERDITQIKEYQQQLIQAQKMESLGKLAGGVAHEINTPLGVILGYAQLLQEDTDSGSQMNQDLAIIEKQAKVCRKIVADLLGFSRQAESARHEMCFNNSVMEAVSLVRHAFDLDRVDLVTDLDDSFPIISGDSEKLKQVWINLLTNAKDAMDDMGGTILLRTRLDYPARKVVLWVADNGSGISPDDIEKIFDPFFSTKPVGVGTGLGLSVSFGIIQDHGGTIRVESPLPEAFEFPYERKGGTVFRVDLPLDHESEAMLEVEAEIDKES